MANTYIDSMTSTWSNSSNSYTAIKMSVNNSLSAADSKVIDLLVNSVSMFSVDKNGNTVANNISITGFSSGGLLNFQVKTNDYTLANSDTGTLLVVNKASNVTITVPNTLPSGFGTTFVQVGVGQIVFANAAGMNMNHVSSGNTTANQYSSVSLLVYETGNSVLIGDVS